MFENTFVEHFDKFDKNIAGETYRNFRYKIRKHTVQRAHGRRGDVIWRASLKVYTALAFISKVVSGYLSAIF